MHRVRVGLVAGALFGLAVLHRPFDAVLAVVPVSAYCAYAARRELHALARDAGAIALGALPFLVAFAAYNRAVMGSVTRLAFGVTGPVDSFGFGWHASFYVPGTGHAGQIDYTIGRAFTTLRETLAVWPKFIALAPAVLACAGLALWRQRRDARVWLLAAMIGIVVVGYFVWWGTANAIHFRLYKYLGPFYEYAALAPLCVAAAWGACSLRTNRSRIALLLLGVMWAGAAAVISLSDAADAGRARSAEVALFAGHDTRLILDAPIFPSDPYVRYANRAALDGPLVVGNDIEGLRLATVDRFPGHALYAIRRYRHAFDDFGPTIVDRVPLHVLHASALSVRVHAAPRPDLVATAFLAVGAEPPQYGAQGTTGIDATFTLQPSMLPADGTVAVVSAGVMTAPATGPAPTTMTGDWESCRFEARRTHDNRIEAFTPYDGWHHATYPDGSTSTTREDLTGVLDVDITTS